MGGRTIRTFVVRYLLATPRKPFRIPVARAGKLRISQSSRSWILMSGLRENGGTREIISLSYREV